jgi:hypothetical protein
MLSAFSSSKCSLFHNSNVFGSCIIYISYTECAKIKKNSDAKSLMTVIRQVATGATGHRRKALGLDWLWELCTEMTFPAA